jgi:hypothetical protein
MLPRLSAELADFRVCAGGATFAAGPCVVARSGAEANGRRSEDIATAVREIERYLEAHPNASDTLQGVRDWWLAGTVKRFALEDIQRALDLLVESGVIEPRSIPGGVLYGRVRSEESK